MSNQNLEVCIEACTAAARAVDFGTLMQPHLPFLQRYAQRLTGNRHDAEDLVQDLMLKLYPQRDRLMDLEALQPWLARVMYHLCIDQYRRQRGLSTISLSQGDDEGAGMAADFDIADETPGPEAQLQQHEVHSRMAAALAELPVEVQELVRLHELEGESLPDLSQRLSIPLNTLKSRLKRARHSLRASLCGEPAAATAAMIPVAAPAGADYYAWA